MEWNDRLNEAIRADDLKKVKAALSRGADPLTGLHLAISTGKADLFQNILASTSRATLSRLDGDGRTLLMHAVERGRFEMVKALLAAGADPNQRDPVFGNTPLRHAAAEGSVELIRLLLQHNANPLIPGRMMLTALDRARERRTPEGRTIASMLERHLHPEESDIAPPRRPAKRPPVRAAARPARRPAASSSRAAKKRRVPARSKR